MSAGVVLPMMEDLILLILQLPAGATNHRALNLQN